MKNAAIIGGSGYTGGELIRILLRHPGVRLGAVASRRHESSRLADAFPWLEGVTDMVFTSPEAVAKDGSIDLVFTALGHTESAPFVSLLLELGRKVVDLSADFRFRDPSVYEKWYGVPHPCPELLSKAVYGLPERNREAIAEAVLCANPGCYATAALLGLLPLASSGLAASSGIIIDAKSGVSGAGRVPRDNTVFPECNEGLRPYSVGNHRHQPEIEAELGAAAGVPMSVVFVPHLIPASRGIMATIYAGGELTPAEAVSLYEKYFRGHPFVRVSPEGAGLPGIQDVKGSNLCRLAIREAPGGGLIIFSVIDNLVKGASGQAVQNMNIMLGLPEDSGLAGLPLSP